MTHDYKRHGTTTMFAALNVLTGEVIGQCHGRHRHQEFLKFLRHLDRALPPDLTLHVILDNYATHKHKKVCKWLDQTTFEVIHEPAPRQVGGRNQSRLVSDVDLGVKAGTHRADLGAWFQKAA